MGFIFSLLFGSFLASAFNKGDCVFAGDIDLENYKEECEYFNDLAPNNKYFCGYYTCERKESVTITANGTETTTQQELPLTYKNGQCTGTVNGVDQTRTAVTKEEYRTDLYTQIENKCERMREEAQEIAQDQKDTQEQVEEAQKDAQEQAAKAQQDKQRQCQAQHRDFLTERDAIERQVQQTQSQIDRLRDQITNKRTLISGGEQQLTEAIRQLQQTQRNTLQEFEENLEQTEIQSRNALRQLETQALIKMNQLEQLANEKNSVCSERFNNYDFIRDNCYEQALAEVAQQRNSYYQRLYSSEVQYRNASDIFSENLKTVEQRFTGLFYSKRQQCYARDIGETEIVSCTVQSLRNRDEACRGSNAANCPTPKARAIEDNVLLKLSNIESSEKTVQLELDNLYKSLEEFPENKAEAVELMKQRLQNEEQKFQEEHVSLRERLSIRSINGVSRVIGRPENSPES